MDIEMQAASLEAEQANRDMMTEWLSSPHVWYDSSWITALRYYRGAAERVHDAMINDQVTAIVPTCDHGTRLDAPDGCPTCEAEDGGHLDYPHWPGYLVGCPACEELMAEAYEAEYDNREHHRDGS